MESHHFRPMEHSPTDGYGCGKARKNKEDKYCGVCGDRALGYNFDAISCESCKAFFRRNAPKGLVSVCGGWVLFVVVLVLAAQTDTRTHRLTETYKDRQGNTQTCTDIDTDTYRYTHTHTHTHTRARARTHRD